MSPVQFCYIPEYLTLLLPTDSLVQSVWAARASFSRRNIRCRYDANRHIWHAERQDRPVLQVDHTTSRASGDELSAMHSQLPRAPQEKQAVLPELPPMPAGASHNRCAQCFLCVNSLRTRLSLDTASQHAVSEKHQTGCCWSLCMCSCTPLCPVTGSMTSRVLLDASSSLVLCL